MTIHKAKGLDFRHVYLVQANKGAPKKDTRMHDAAWIGGGWHYRLFGAETPGWELVEEGRTRVRKAELVRLEYVALTRAKDRLVVAGAWPTSPTTSEPGSVLELLQRRADLPDLGALFDSCAATGQWRVDREGVRWAFPALAAAGREPAADSRRPELPSVDALSRETAVLALRRDEASLKMRQTFGATASAEAHRMLEETSTAADGEMPGPRAVRTGRLRDVATAVGSAVHELLEVVDLSQPVREAITGASAVLDRRLQETIRGEQLRKAQQRGRELLRRLASSELGRRLEAVAGGVIARELPILALPRKGDDAVGFVAGAVDLLYRDPDDGTLVVADYKTDEVEGDEEIAARARAYASQGAAYVRAVAAALALPEAPRFELWFLWPGRIVVVSGCDTAGADSPAS
jgi:ATP-dependent exoDNAse (exonuclease V) beta subunit